jgi:hypothetical protein
MWTNPGAASKAFALGLVLVFCASGAEQAAARSQKHRFDSLTVPSIPVDATGTPVIMQGLEHPTNAVEDRHERKEAKRPVHIPRGSASLVPAGSSSLLRERLRWAHRSLSPLTTRPPSTAPATASSNPTNRFRSTAAWATIPATVTPTYATTSAADRSRSAGSRKTQFYPRR